MRLQKGKVRKGKKMKDKNQMETVKPNDLYVCDKCGSENIRLLETEYMMGKEIKRYICEACETKFFINEE